MAQKFINNAKTILNGSIAAADLTLTVKTGDGALFPVLGTGDFFYLTLVEYDGTGKEIDWEIVKVTGRTTDTLTIARAQEGTTAQIWLSGTRVENRFTAGTADGFALKSSLSIANWNLAHGWGNHAVQGYLVDGGISNAKMAFNAGIRLNDDDVIELGSSADAKLVHNGTNLLLDLVLGDLLIRDNVTTRMTLERVNGRMKANAFAPGLKTVAPGVTTTFNLINGTNYVVTLNQNSTFAFTTDAASYGMSGTIIVKQDVTGGRTFTLPAAAKTPVGGAVINQVTAANTVSLLGYFVIDASTILINYVGDFQ